MEELLLNETNTGAVEEAVEGAVVVLADKTTFVKGVGVGVLGTAVALTGYKYVVKPLAKKVKDKIAAKKAAKAAEQVVSEQ